MESADKHWDWKKQQRQECKSKQEEVSADAEFCACTIIFLNQWFPEGRKEVLSEHSVTAKLCYVMGLVSRENFLEGDGRYLTGEEHLQKTED